ASSAGTRGKNYRPKSGELPARPRLRRRQAARPPAVTEGNAPRVGPDCRPPACIGLPAIGPRFIRPARWAVSLLLC
ncbi:unnamed protein product, partial [Amoebophrya sp. A120]